MVFVLTALGAALAVALELAEASAIVLAVGVSRRWSDALIGAAAGVVGCAVLAAAIGPALLEGAARDTVRVIVGALLILFGLDWLGKATLRLAGRRERSSSVAEFEAVEEELAGIPMPEPGQADWAARAIAFKGVLLEGIEVVLIVSVLAARPAGPTPAIVGGAFALAATVVIALLLRRPLARVPETELKWFVGVLLTAFGAFFFAEGLGGGWPGGDASLLLCLATLALASRMLVLSLTPRSP